ncbi:MAG TPA: hypothetical protein VFM18_19880 [Methanosarcina sp.]|nr:hypothetical protein [Methanosarcina sp.]
MSIWSQISGYALIRKDKHVSVREIIKETLGEDEVLPVVSSENCGDKWRVDINISFCQDGETATKRSRDFIKKIQEVSVSSDFIVEVRWVS